MKKLFLFALICATGLILNAQNPVTVTFKPDATIGKDAIVFTRVGANDANTNYGNYPELIMITWTWDGNLGTIRSLIKFEELSTIPSNAVITNVQLKFFGVYSSGIAPQGNSYYTGSTFPTNPVLVSRVTSTWNENTVTWNTQPTTTTTNQMLIPASATQWGWDYTINNTNDLKAIVQDMVNNPSSNHGFMLQLQTEATYRDMLFGSSDNPNPELWPELIVTYTVCEADFTYCVTTDSINVYTFTSLNPNYPNHNWIIDGQYVSHDPSFEFYLSPGTHKICYVAETGDDKCEKCIAICVDENAKSELEQKSQEIIKQQPTDSSVQGTIPACDVVSENILIFPNPTRDIWSLKINSLNEEEVEISIVDVEGKLIYSHTESLKKGDNNFSIGNKNYNKGTYILNIKGRTIKSSRKIVKE